MQTITIIQVFAKSLKPPHKNRDYFRRIDVLCFVSTIPYADTFKHIILKANMAEIMLVCAFIRIKYSAISSKLPISAQACDRLSHIVQTTASEPVFCSVCWSCSVCTQPPLFGVALFPRPFFLLLFRRMNQIKCCNNGNARIHRDTGPSNLFV